MLAFAQAEEKAGVRRAQLMLRRRVGAACKLLLHEHLKQRRVEFFCSSSAEVQHGVGGAPLAYPSKRRARQRACLGACHLSWKQGKDARAVPRVPSSAGQRRGPRPPQRPLPARGEPWPRPRPAASPRGRALATARTRRQREAPARQRRADPERCPWAPPPGATMSDPRPG